MKGFNLDLEMAYLDKLDELEERIWNLIGSEELLVTLLWYMDYETKRELLEQIADEYELEYDLEVNEDEFV